MLDQKTIRWSRTRCSRRATRDADAVLLVELDGPRAESAGRGALRTLGGEFGVRSARATTAEAHEAVERRKGAFGTSAGCRPTSTCRTRSSRARGCPDAEARARDATNTACCSPTSSTPATATSPNISYDGRDQDGEARRRRGREMLAACIAMGGSLSRASTARHREARRVRLQFTNDDLDVFGRVRRAFNPLGLCNRTRCCRARGVHRVPARGRCRRRHPSRERDGR